ncbi:MAG: ATP-binding protein [Myxococcota bacterium]
MASEAGTESPRAAVAGSVGLALVLAPLAVALVICALHFHSELEARSERNRAQGVSLARLLSQLPYDSLTGSGGASGPLELVRNSQTNPDFAYVLLARLDGSPLDQVAAPGVAPAVAPAQTEVAAWIGERLVTPAVGRGVVREFFAPVIDRGERVAELRVAFFEPGAGMLLSEASELAAFALPVFLLAPLSYLAFRRGLRPIAAVTEEMRGLVEARRFDTVELQAQGEVGQFIRGFNEFMELARARVRELEEERTGILASSKVVAYQQSRIEAVLGALPDPTLVLDPTGTPIFATPQLGPAIGLDAEDFVGRPAADWCSHAELLGFLTRAVRSGGAHSPERGEFEFETSLGPRRFEIERHLIGGADGSAAGVGTLVTFRDVSESRASQRTQGEFVAHVAHELKSPLHVMSMYGESLLDAEAASEEFRIEASNVIRDEVERLDSLVRSLLSISQIEAGTLAVDRQRLRVPDFLADCVEAVSRSAAKRSISFTVHAPADGGVLFVDKDLLRVAVNNLLTNAIKYNRDGGEVAVHGEDVGTRYEIRVRDGGIGIAEEELEHVFEKFFRSSDPEVQKRGGHGLGLALTERIVELHGGRISVQSRPGEGSEFTISLRKRTEA